MSECKSEVWRGDTWSEKREACGKPAKGTDANGTPLCGLHLRAYSNRVDKAAAQEAWQKRVDAVAKAFGVPVNGGFEPNGFVTLHINNAELLAERIARAKL
jgi:hypothetical protein